MIAESHVEDAALAGLVGFKELVREGAIRHCGCKEPTFPVYFMPSCAARELEQLHRDALRLFRSANEKFEEPAW
jgi:hypothetical protein